jgi:hypothetical protein
LLSFTIPIIRREEVLPDGRRVQSATETDMQLEGMADKAVTLKNLFNTHLQYLTKSDALFFLVDCPESGWITTKYVTHSVAVRPNPDIILKNKKYLMKERVVEEHFVIYNQNRLTELCRVLLRLSVEGVDPYYVPMGRSVYTSGTLEQNTARFLADWPAFWREYVTGENKVARVLARLAKLSETNDDFKLFFDYNHIVDELAFYGVRRKQLAPLVFSLAHALFK